jgi:hypothetical protein
MNELNIYSRSKIYKIVCNKTGLFYIGSTTQQTLSKRLSSHVSGYKKYLITNIHYITSYNIIKNGDYQIILIRACPCDNKDELKAIEADYIRTMKRYDQICVLRVTCVNKVIPGRTNKEYRKDNKDKLAGIHNCECGGIWSLQHKPRHDRSNIHKRYLCRLARDLQRESCTDAVC